jgi:hypothetical protein
VIIAPGAVLQGRHGRYQVLAEHRQGGFGTTFHARTDAGTEVMLKVLRLERMGSWKAHELFEREAAVLRALDHPAIPAWIDDFPLGTAEVPTGFALVQQLIPGPTLHERRRAGGLDPDEMRAWFQQILQVLVYLHGRSPPVIHRDVTPRNIILRPEGAALVDFGSVQAALRGSHTVSSTAAGTFGYAPPEQFVGRAGPGSDLYGLGMSYLAAASGREPEQMPVDGLRVDVRTLLPTLEPRLRALLERMTAPDPRQRLGSAAEALAALGGDTPAETVARVDALPAYLTLLRERLQAEGFSVMAGGQLGGTALALTATRAPSAWQASAVRLYVAEAEALPGPPQQALQAFSDAARASAPVRRWPERWLSPTTIVPVVIGGAPIAPTMPRPGALVLPVQVNLAAGEARVLAETANLKGDAVATLPYVWWLATPRLAERPATNARASFMRMGLGVAAGLVLLLGAALAAVLSMPTGTFFLTYAADPGQSRVALKAQYRRAFFFGTDVLTLDPARGLVARGRLPADAVLCQLGGERLGYWRSLGDGQAGYFRAALDGGGATQLLQAPLPARWSCGVRGDDVIYPDRARILWLKEGGAEARPLPGTFPGDQDPAWFPQGQAVVVAGMTEQGLRLTRLELATGERTMLLDEPRTAGAHVRPSVSPDGTRVAFYRSVRRSFGDLERRGGEVHDLEVLTIATGTSRLLLQDVCFTVAPAWLRADELLLGKWVGDRCGLFRYDLRTEQAILLARDY